MDLKSKKHQITGDRLYFVSIQIANTYNSKSNVLESRAKITEIVPLSKYLWFALYVEYNAF